MRDQRNAMQLWIDLHVLITLVTLISSGNLPGTDASINTVEEFLDTLINSSRYDRRIRPYVEQQSKFGWLRFLSLRSLSFCSIAEPCNVTMTIHINTISAINEVNMVRHMHQ